MPVYDEHLRAPVTLEVTVADAMLLTAGIHALLDGHQGEPPSGENAGARAQFHRRARARRRAENDLVDRDERAHCQLARYLHLRLARA